MRYDFLEKVRMSKMSRDKGKVGEREVAALLRQYGFNARRGQQYAGGGDSPDVVHNIPGIHIEVKRVEALRLYPALQQASGEAAYVGTIPTVFHRKNNEEWVVILPADDFLMLMKERNNG